METRYTAHSCPSNIVSLLASEQPVEAASTGGKGEPRLSLMLNAPRQWGISCVPESQWHAAFRSSFLQPPTIVCQGFCHVQDCMLPGNRMMNSLFKSRRGGGVLSLFFAQRLIPQEYLSFFRLQAHWHVQDRMLPENRMMNSLFNSRRGEGVLSTGGRGH